MPKDLRTFIEEVAEKRPDDLVRVEREVDPKHELTAVVEKLERAGEFPAVYFEHVKGSDFPIIINVTASYDRLAMALDTELDHMVQTFCEREENPIPPVEVSGGPVKEVVLTGTDADLSILPVTTHNALDAGPYICSGLGICKDPETGKHNVGIYRHMVHDHQTLGNWIYEAHHGYYVWQRYAARNEPMPFAIAIGHHPGAIMGAISRYPGIGGEFDGSGGLMNEPLEVAPAETVDLMVPARAEIVVEGTVHPTELRQEGPFGEWPRYYTATGPQARHDGDGHHDAQRAHLFRPLCGPPRTQHRRRASPDGQHLSAGERSGAQRQGREHAHERRGSRARLHFPEKERGRRAQTGGLRSLDG